MSAFTVIYWCADCICKAGEYAYRVKLKYESECFVFQVVVTLICSFILIVFRVPIAHIYSLTDTQYVFVLQGFMLNIWKTGVFLQKLHSFNLSE